MQKCPSDEDPPCYPTVFVLDSALPWHWYIGALPQDKGWIRINTACAGCGPWCCAHLHAACFLRTCTWPRASVLPWKPFTWAAVGHRLWIVVLSRQKAPAPYKVFSTRMEKEHYWCIIIQLALTAGVYHVFIMLGIIKNKNYSFRLGRDVKPEQGEAGASST